MWYKSQLQFSKHGDSMLRHAQYDFMGVFVLLLLWPFILGVLIANPIPEEYELQGKKIEESIQQAVIEATYVFYILLCEHRVLFTMVLFFPVDASPWYSNLFCPVW